MMSVRGMILSCWKAECRAFLVRDGMGAAWRLRLLFILLLLWGGHSVGMSQMATELKMMDTTSVAKHDEVPELKDASAREGKRPKPRPAEIKPLQPKQRDTLQNESKRTLVYLERADVITFDEEIMADAQLLRGDVVMRHDEAYLYCDSAHFFQKSNMFNAYGNVRIEQGDSIFVYGDVLYYNGDTKLARLRQNVRMINGEVTLTTDSLNYDRSSNIGYYFGGGQIVDSLNTLVSEKGYYYADTKLADFRHNVVGTNKDFIMYSDTLHYDTESKVADIVGPTNIVYKEETTIYSELGWYNTDTQKSQLLKNSTVTQEDGKQLKGDTIYYDKVSGVGKAFSNVELNDTSHSISLYGHYGYYQELDDIGLVTDSALMVEYSSEDTLYLNADTLYSYAVDSDKIVLAYYNVRIFREDLQGVCDTMVYRSADSTLTMMHRPVLWSDNQQLNGDTVRIFFDGEYMDRMHVVGNAFVSQDDDGEHYNQMSGKEIMCYMGDSSLRQVDVIGNAESIYFPRDEGELVGMNQVQGSYMNIYLDNGKIERIVVYPQPTGKMYPVSMIREDNMFLLNFSWMESLRPKNARDVFNRPEIKATEDPEAQRKAILEQEKIKREEERQKRKEEMLKNAEYGGGEER